MIFDQNNFKKKKNEIPIPSNPEFEDIGVEDQLLQQALFDSKFKLNKKNNIFGDLPSDFYNEELMNKSFYKDILEIEKQKAILEDLNKNKSAKNKSRYK